MKIHKILLLILVFVGLSKFGIAQPSRVDSSGLSDSHSSTQVGIAPDDTATENTYTYNDAIYSVITTRGSIIILLIFILGILLGGWAVFYFSKRKVYAILKEERVYYLDYPPLKSEQSIFHYITLFHVLKRRKDSYKKHNAEIKKQLDELSSVNNLLRDKI